MMKAFLDGFLDDPSVENDRVTDGPFKTSTKRSKRRTCRCNGESEEPCRACQAAMDDDEPDSEFSEDGRERFVGPDDD